MSIQKFYINNLDILKSYKDYINSRLQKYSDLSEKKCLIFGTGHQPINYHPGIILKNLTISEFAKKYNDIYPINYIINYDNIPTTLFKLLCYNKKYSVIDFYNPGYNNWIFYNNSHITNKLYDILNNNPVINKEYILKLINNKHSKNIFTNMRNNFQNDFNFSLQDVDAVNLYNTDKDYYIFLFKIISNTKTFFYIYNKQLNNYRTQHKIRSNNNPFPNLIKKNDSYELPFWIYYEHKKESLFIKIEKNNKFKILLKDKEIIFSDVNELINLSPDISIFPKAITNSIFLRYWQTDLFIHGTGGEKYDIITDAIVKDFFKFDIKPFITVSGTLTFGDEKNIENIENIKNNFEQQIRTIKNNPEKYISDNYKTDIPTNIKKLLDEKNVLIEEIKKVDSNKKLVHDKIQANKEKLISFLENDIQSIRNNISNCDDNLEQERILVDREYPIYQFDSDIIIKYFDEFRKLII